MDILRIKHPSTIIVAGPTQSGKTHFTKKLVEYCSQLFDPPPKHIYWAYSEWQPGYQELSTWPNLQMVEGIPELSVLKMDNEPKLLILDDLMQTLKTDPRLIHLFTKGCHHWNLSCVHIVQNLFFDGLRTARVNAQYIVLLKNPSDQSQVRTLAKQLFPGKAKYNYFIESYQDACEKPHGYLFCDLNQATPDNMRLRTNIFPGELHIVYCPK